MFNCFQGIGKETLQLPLCHLDLLVRSRCPGQSILSPRGSLSGLACGSGRVLSSAGQSLALSPCMPVNVGMTAVANVQPWLSEHQQCSSCRCAVTALTACTGISSLLPDVLQIFVIFTCCELSYFKTVSISGQIRMMLGSV